METIIDKKWDNVRLDRFIREECAVPQGYVSRMVRKGGIKVNNKKTEINYLLTLGDSVQIYGEIEQKTTAPKKKQFTEEDIASFKALTVFDTEDFFIIDKPSGLATQGGTKIQESVDDYIVNINEEYRIVHRLDRETSGLLIIAKNRQSATRLIDLFSQHKIVKKYYTTVHGVVLRNEGTIDAKILRAPDGVVCSNDGKEAITEYDVYERFEKTTALVVTPKTGRMHQIRVHLAHIGHPIVGDGRYGKDRDIVLNLRCFSVRIPGYDEIKVRMN